MPKKHGLGWGNGRIVEYEDGTAGYIGMAGVTQEFRVKIAEVTGFSVTKNGKVLERRINVLGNGTLLGQADVAHGAAEKIEAWFRGHPDFASAGRPTTVAASGAAAPAGSGADMPTLIADELRKLAMLRDEGILTRDEFAAEKRRLLGR